MAEYYAVLRSGERLEHAVTRGSGSGTAVYKNSKYLARVKQPNGKYRYFYEIKELSAFKNGGTSTPGEAKPPKVKGKRPPSFGNSHLSSGALTYKGESDNTNYQSISDLAANGTPQEVSGRKKKKKSKKSRTSYIIANINRR